MDKYRNDKAEWRMIESKIGDTELGNEGLLNKLELDEARGMMVGTAIGDAMGAPLEFEPKCRPEDNLVTDMIGGGHHNVKAGEWTDDTAMMLALADAYTRKNGLDPVKAMENFYAWYTEGKYQSRGECFDIGYTTRSALENWHNGIAEHANYALMKDYVFRARSNEKESGNGAMMRLAPVIVANGTQNAYLDNLSSVVQDTVVQTLLTHGGKEAIDLNVELASTLYRMNWEIYVCSFSDQGGVLSHMHSTSTPREQIMSGGYVKETYNAALWAFDKAVEKAFINFDDEGYAIFDKSDIFRDTIINAINLGHDSDTTGAIAGMIAGRILGMEYIPKEWLEKLHWKDKIIAEADRLYSYNQPF